MLGLAVATALLLAACGDDDASSGAATVATVDDHATSAPGSTVTTVASEVATTATASTEVSSTSDAPIVTVDDIAVVEVVDGIEWYEPCGNVPLRVDGDVWWPLLPEELEAIDETRYPEPDEPQGLATRVVPPGPGDDVGTLVVYSDGIARFESDSGAIVIWLGDEARSYDWVC